MELCSRHLLGKSVSTQGHHISIETISMVGLGNSAHNKHGWSRDNFAITNSAPEDP